MTNNYTLGHHEVEARRHSGSDECAQDLASWIRSLDGQVDVILTGHFEWDRNFAFLKLHNRYDRLVQPNFWVVKTDDNQFYSVYPNIFRNMYRPIHLERTHDDLATASKDTR